ncbi:MAG: HlyD family efflux transporter periplasmic adaptor subunit [Bdellovibrionales bacterium]|nr:HlyD family efflux transporter periplasmic adaptor subunit [Bdellovibrionales bacterium]
MFEVVESSHADENDYPRETSRFLSWNAISLIKSPGPDSLLVPVIGVLILIVAGVILLLGAEVVDSSVTEGRLVLQDAQVVKATETAIVKEMTVGIGQRVSRGDKFISFSDGSGISIQKPSVLIRRFVEVGSLVAKGDELAVLGEVDSPWIAKVEIKEKDFHSLKQGQEVSLQLQDEPHLGTIGGKLVEIVSYRAPSASLDGEVAFANVALTLNPSIKAWLGEKGVQAYGSRVRVVLIKGRAPASVLLRQFF